MTDGFLQRLERDAALACAAMAIVAGGAPGGGWPAALGVVGGGLLAAISYRAVKGAVGALGPGARQGAALVKFFTRHAILAFAAYVMLARLRLPVLAVLLGASSLVVAAALAAARTIGPASRSGHPR